MATHHSPHRNGCWCCLNFTLGDTFGVPSSRSTKDTWWQHTLSYCDDTQQAFDVPLAPTHLHRNRHHDQLPSASSDAKQIQFLMNNLCTLRMQRLIQPVALLQNHTTRVYRHRYVRHRWYYTSATSACIIVDCPPLTGCPVAIHLFPHRKLPSFYSD